ncbi:MAG TPA: efflux RND transporter periplasmic adaptor subunit [Thermoanaerobaculia bacterium]|jgi:HlyD family secretion protein
MDRRISAPRLPRVPAIIGAIVVVAIATILLLPGTRRWWRADRAVDATTIRTATVMRGDLLRDISVQARVVAALHPTLFSPAQGIISIKTKAGTQAHKGDVLATIESTELRSSLSQAQSLLISQRADLARQNIVSRQTNLRAEQQVGLTTLRLEAARRNLTRNERMFKEGLSNRSDYESAQDAVRVAEMELTQAKKELGMGAETLNFDLRNRQEQVKRQESVTAELQRKVEELTVRAPFDGMVATVNVQDRDAIAANQAILTIVNLSSFELELTLPEEYAADTSIGTPAIIAFEGREYTGNVTAISPEVVNSQVTTTVAFKGATPPGLKQSQRLTTRLVFESKKDVLKVARGAFVESGGGRVAYVVNGKLAARRPIALGVTSVNEVEVVSGLREGETIVVSDTTPFENANEVLLR